MLAVSSSFHNLVARDIFIGRERYFSFTTLKTIVKYSLVLSLGLISFGFLTIIFAQVGTNIIVPDLISSLSAWIFHTVYFSIVLIFLVFVASMSIRRSFSKKDATKNFFFATISSSILYISIRYIAIEIFENKLLAFGIFLLFTLAAYFIIKRKDRELSCPKCDNKMKNLEEIEFSCPNCAHTLYSWAIYQF
jgi:positive regulator of sigma E activity